MKKHRSSSRRLSLWNSGSPLKLEYLEKREVLTALIGLTTTDALIQFDSASPGTLTAPAVPVTGLATGETLVGIDIRPSTGVLYGVGSGSHLYTINPATGVATAVSATAFSPALNGTSFGVDFDPVGDRLRVVGASGQNLTINPTTGTATADPTLAYDSSDSGNTAFFPSSPFPAPNLVAAAYTSNVDQTTNTPVTTLYAIDSTQDALVRIGGANGNPNADNSQAVVVAKLRDASLTPVPFGTTSALDIQAGTDNAFAANGSTLYGITLSTATAASLGAVGGGFSLEDLAVAPSVPGSGTVSISSNTLSFTSARKPLAVTVTRTGGSTGAITVDYATADGTGKAGVDYLPTSGTLQFADGQTSQTIFLMVPAGTVPASPAKTFTLNLSNATGGAALGSTASATVTVPAVVNTSFRFFAVGSSTDARVSVYDSNGGALLFTFRAFEGNFNGAARVAVGDVNGDGYDDIIVGAGPGAGPRVQVFDGSTLSASNQTQLASFFAFDSRFGGGVSVASGDVNGDGVSDIVVGAGAGADPHVRILDGQSATGGSTTELASFDAFDAAFKGGVNVAAGDFNGDSSADVVVGAGAGGQSHVSVFDGKALLSNTQTQLASFFAFDAGFQGGVAVAAGDVNGDSRADVIVGAGQGGGSHVEVFDGRTLASAGQTSLASFFAFDQQYQGEVTVASRDINGDGFDDLIVGAGQGGQGHVSEFSGLSLKTGPIVTLASFNAFDSSFQGGVFVG